MTYIRLDEHRAVPNGQVFVSFATMIRVSLNPSYTGLKLLGHEVVHSPMGRTMRTSNLKLVVAQLIKKVFPSFGIQTFSPSYTPIHDLIMNGQVVEGVQNFRY